MQMQLQLLFDAASFSFGVFVRNMWSLINGEEFRRRRAAIVREFENEQVALYRKIIDRAWNEATDSGTVPSTEWADRIIEAARGDLPYVGHAYYCSTWDLRPCNCKLLAGKA